MNITRDVVLDLWSLVEAGEASDDSRALVEAFAREDRTFASMVERSRRVGAHRGAPIPALTPDHEKRSLDATKSLLGKRSWSLAGAVLFLLLPFSVAWSSEGGLLWFMWRDNPALAALSTCAGLVLWYLHVRTGVKIRTVRSG